MKCCDMTAGMLRIPVTLQSQTRTADDGGGWTLVWATYATVQAHLRRKSGMEAFVQERLSEQPQLRCVIRYRSDVEPQHRALIDGKMYNIRSVDDVEFRRRWLDMTLEGGVPS